MWANKLTPTLLKIRLPTNNWLTSHMYNHLTVCKQKWALACFKMLSTNCSYWSYICIKRIWHKISYNVWYAIKLNQTKLYRVKLVNCHLNYTKRKIILTSRFIRYIYQNYMKISWNTIDWIYSKKLSYASTVASRWIQNLLQAFPMISLFKLVNAAIILPFSSSLVLQRVLLVSRSTMPHT